MGEAILRRHPISKYKFGHPEFIQLYAGPGEPSTQTITATVKGTYFVTAYAMSGNNATLTTTGTTLYDRQTTETGSIQATNIKIVTLKAGESLTYKSGNPSYMLITYIPQIVKFADLVKVDSNSAWAPNNVPTSSSKNVTYTSQKDYLYFFAACSRANGSSGSSAALLNWGANAYSVGHNNISADYQWIVVPDQNYTDAGIKLSSWANSYGSIIYGYLFWLHN